MYLAGAPETSVRFHQPTRRHVAGDRVLHMLILKLIVYVLLLYANV
jgi:hypothetical protein